MGKPGNTARILSSGESRPQSLPTASLPISGSHPHHREGPCIECVDTPSHIQVLPIPLRSAMHCPPFRSRGAHIPGGEKPGRDSCRYHLGSKFQGYGFPEHDSRRGYLDVGGGIASWPHKFTPSCTGKCLEGSQKYSSSYRRAGHYHKKIRTGRMLAMYPPLKLWASGIRLLRDTSK